MIYDVKLVGFTRRKEYYLVNGHSVIYDFEQDKFFCTCKYHVFTKFWTDCRRVKAVKVWKKKNKGTVFS